MKIMKKILTSLFWAIPLYSFSQDHLDGKVVEKIGSTQESSLGMVSLKWVGTQITATTDETGSFHISFPESMPAKLVVSMIGYQNDTVLFNNKSKTNLKIYLTSAATTLNAVSITGKIQNSSNMITSSINIEKITQKELTLAACCNLSESFERNASPVSIPQ